MPGTKVTAGGTSGWGNLHDSRLVVREGTFFTHDSLQLHCYPPAITVRAEEDAPFPAVWRVARKRLVEGDGEVGRNALSGHEVVVRDRHARSSNKNR